MPEHLDGLRLQPEQAELQYQLGIPGYARAIEGPHTWTGLVDGRVVGVCGIQEKWKGRGLAWALLTTGLTARDFLRAHNKVREILDLAQIQKLVRVETAVLVKHEEANRWARTLGFEREGLMKKYSPEGNDAWLYARVA